MPGKGGYDLGGQHANKPAKLSVMRRELRDAGWEHTRTRGSHETWTHPDTTDSVTFVSKGKGELKPGEVVRIRRAIAGVPTVSRHNEGLPGRIPTGVPAKTVLAGAGDLLPPREWDYFAVPMSVFKDGILLAPVLANYGARTFESLGDVLTDLKRRRLDDLPHGFFRRHVRDVTVSEHMHVDRDYRVAEWFPVTATMRYDDMYQRARVAERDAQLGIEPPAPPSLVEAPPAKAPVEEPMVVKEAPTVKTTKGAPFEHAGIGYYLAPKRTRADGATYWMIRLSGRPKSGDWSATIGWQPAKTPRDKLIAIAKEAIEEKIAKEAVMSSIPKMILTEFEITEGGITYDVFARRAPVGLEADQRQWAMVDQAFGREHTSAIEIGWFASNAARTTIEAAARDEARRVATVREAAIATKEEVRQVILVVDGVRWRAFARQRHPDPRINKDTGVREFYWTMSRGADKNLSIGWLPHDVADATVSARMRYRVEGAPAIESAANRALEGAPPSVTPPVVAVITEKVEAIVPAAIPALREEPSSPVATPVVEYRSPDDEIVVRIPPGSDAHAALALIAERVNAATFGLLLPDEIAVVIKRQVTKTILEALEKIALK